jgi:hypothetical protein
MKKTLLALLLVSGICSGSYAQMSLKIYDAVTNADVTNTVIQINQDTMTVYAGNFNVKNISSSNISTKFRKEEITMSGGTTPSTSSICYAGTCFGPVTYVSPCKATNAGTTVATTCDFNFGNQLTASTIRYTVYNCGNPGDSASFIINYNAMPAGILNHVLSFTISDAYPNPASSTLNFNYKISNNSSPVHIAIHNLLGNLIKSADMMESNGSVRLDVSDLEEGLYFYTLEVNNKPLAIRKFIVKR